MNHDSIEAQLRAEAQRLAEPVVAREAWQRELLTELEPRRTSYQRRQFTWGLLTATAVVVIAIGFGILGLGGEDSADPDPVVPLPTSTPTAVVTEDPQADRQLSPEEVLEADNAALQTMGFAAGNPDVRIALWSAECRKCRPVQGSTFSRTYTAMALTTDGYQTTTVVRHPFPVGTDVAVLSLRDDLFFVMDQANGGEWLVDLEGTAREVQRVERQITPADPALWFVCPAGYWRGSWCTLDVDKATMYAWPKKWDGSAIRPGLGQEPWGAHPEPRAASQTGELEAWWYTAAGRQTHVVAEVDGGDYVRNTPAGEMALWAPVNGNIEVHVSRDQGATWEVAETHTAPGTDGFLELWRAPDGALLAYSSYPRFEVWRAEAANGPFVQVYDGPGAAGGETSGAGMRIQDGFVYAAADRAAAMSSDNGLTWTAVSTWR
ncbi:MAG TPA: hypothetical protein VFK52_00725 [Nocardioidaceae bacterium]|nr:hypothetical protein [Nocardioidaceae bacterium]